MSAFISASLHGSPSGAAAAASEPPRWAAAAAAAVSFKACKSRLPKLIALLLPGADPDPAAVRLLLLLWDVGGGGGGGLEGPKLIFTSRLLELVVACCKYLAAASGVMARAGPPSALTFTVLDVVDLVLDLLLLLLLDFLDDIVVVRFALLLLLAKECNQLELLVRNKIREPVLASFDSFLLSSLRRKQGRTRTLPGPGPTWVKRTPLTENSGNWRPVQGKLARAITTSISC